LHCALSVKGKGLLTHHPQIFGCSPFWSGSDSRVS
jgi:hypothetical protein